MNYEKLAQTSGLRGLFLLSGHGVRRLGGRAKKKTEQIFHAGENLRPRKPLVWASLIVLSYFSIVGWIWQSPVARKNKEGTDLYNEGRIDEALSKWRDAQIESPDKEELHYNIGGALHREKKYEDSFNEYEKVLDTKDADLQSKTYYNMGNTHYRMGKLLEAVEDYKKCLDINPDDEDAKYNIEFVRKKIKENLETKEQPQEEMQQQEAQQAQAQQQESQKDEESGEEKDPEGAQEEETPEETKERKEQEKEEGEMSEEDAMRLLDALKDDEKELQKELRVEPGEGRYRVDKDW